MKEYAVPLEQECVFYYPNLFTGEESQQLYDELYKTTGWETSGKINRWVYLMEETPSDYKYRDAPSSLPDASERQADQQQQQQQVPIHHNPFTDTVRTIKTRIEDWYNSHNSQADAGDSAGSSAGITKSPVQFNVCLLNFYEDGNQRIGWHTDREEIGRTTPIASLSLGATRDFQIRSKQNAGRDRATIALESGSLVIMENQCQHDYLHSIPRQSAITQGRINLTFRCKRKDEANTQGEEEHERRDKWLERIKKTNGADGAQEEDFYHYTPGTSICINTNGPLEASSTSSAAVLFGDHMPTTFCNEANPDVKFVISCNIGTEHYLANELTEMLSMMDRDGSTNDDDNDTHDDAHGYSSSWRPVACPWGIAGYAGLEYAPTSKTSTPTPKSTDVTLDEMMDAIQKQLMELRSAMQVLLYQDHFDMRDLVTKDAADGTNGPDQAAAATMTTTTPVTKRDGISTLTAEDLYEYYKQRLVDGKGSIPALHHRDSATIPRASASTSVSAFGDAPNNDGDGKQKRLGFRVSCERVGGPHAFRSDQVEREIGGAMSEYYESSCKPQMKNYNVNIRADIVSTKVLIGQQLNVDDISKRHFVRFRNGVTIKCNIAYVLIRLAGIDGNSKDKLMVDPFCGSGTLLLEALEMTQRRIRCIGMDVSRKSARGARQNAEAENCSNDICEIHCCDARALRRYVPDSSADAFVSNLPWGVMTGNKQGVSDLQQLYEIFLRTAWYCLKDGGRIVMLVLRGLQMTRILRKLSGRYRLITAQVIRTTNNLPCIVVVEKIGRDILHESLKGQLAYMSEFVNVSKELYHAIHMETIDDENGNGGNSSSGNSGSKNNKGNSSNRRSS